MQVAAVSPSSLNYEETISTLQYADQAKQLKTNNVKNTVDTSAAGRVAVLQVAQSFVLTACPAASTAYP